VKSVFTPWTIDPVRVIPGLRKYDAAPTTPTAATDARTLKLADRGFRFPPADLRASIPIGPGFDC
jgi:hypothetical protein